MASSAKVFDGLKVRHFPESEVRFRGVTNMGTAPAGRSTDDGQRATFDGGSNCSKWAVLTTIFSPPTEAARRFLYNKEWCMVIVADKKLDTEVLTPCR